MADLNSRLFRELAQIALGTTPSKGPSNYDIATQILMNSRGSNEDPWKYTRPAAPKKKVDTSGRDDTSTFGRIVDVLSRPLYASANIAKEQLGELTDDDKGLTDVTAMLGLSGLGVASHLPEAWKGFSGKEKTTTRDIRKEVKDNGVDLPDVIDKGVGEFATNLAGDILLDPLTWVPLAGPVKAGVASGYKLAGKDVPRWTRPVHVKKADRAARRANKARNSRLPAVISAADTPNAFTAMPRWQMQGGKLAAPSVDTPAPSALAGYPYVPPPKPQPNGPLLPVSLGAAPGIPIGPAVPNNAPSIPASMPTPLPPPQAGNDAIAQGLIKAAQDAQAAIGKLKGSQKVYKPGSKRPTMKWNANAPHIPGAMDLGFSIAAALRASTPEEAIKALQGLKVPGYFDGDDVIKQLTSGGTPPPVKAPVPRTEQPLNIPSKLEAHIPNSGTPIIGPARKGGPPKTTNKGAPMALSIPGKNALPPGAPREVAEALEDAPLVSGALENANEAKAAATANMSPQQAAVVGKQVDQEAEDILKAAGTSEAAQKTYRGTAKNITYQTRSPAQRAVDKNANKLTVPMNSLLRNKVRGPKGRFLKGGTPIPTVGKSPLPSSKVAQSAMGTPPAPKQGVSIALRAMQNMPLPSSTAKPKPVTGVFGPVNAQVSSAIRNAANIPVRKLKPGETISQFNAVQGYMARFATHLGQEDLRPIALDNLGSALARAGERIRALEKLFKGFNGDEIIEAWEIARKAKPVGIASSPRVTELADKLTGEMEKFFWSRNIPLSAAKGNSVAFRTGMTMEDINRQLQRFNIPFKFTNKAATDPVTGNPLSYEHGPNWLISWETAALTKPDDVKRFIFAMESAGEQLAAEYAFIDDIAERFGSRVKDRLHNVKIEHPRLGDYYFNGEMADQFSRALSTYNDMYNPTSKAARMVRSAVSMWKTGVTIYNPRHYVSNLIGDTYLAWLGGVNDPRVFKQAMKVLTANKGLYSDLASIDELVGADALKNIMGKPGSFVAKNKSGQRFTAQQVYIAAFNLGLLQRTSILDDIVREGLPNIKPFGGRVHNFVAARHEGRDHYIKLAHFIDQVNKSTGKDYKDIFEQAAHEVRKWHPDGLDLTKSEQRLRSLAIPFYSWTRKSIPLLMQGAVMRPQRAFTSYAKVNLNLQESLGIEGTSLQDPLPTDQLFPSWLREDNVAALGKPGMPGLAGMIGDLGRQRMDPETGQPIEAYTMAGPTNPMQDTFSMFGNMTPGGIAKGIGSSLNPMARIPLELYAGKEMYSGIPLKDRHADYATNQVPMVSQLSRMTNLTPFGGTTSRAEEYGIGNREASINWGTGANITGSGAYMKSAEFEEKPRITAENKKIREFSAEIGYPLKDKGRIPDWIRTLYAEKNGGQ